MSLRAGQRESGYLAASALCIRVSRISPEYPKTRSSEFRASSQKSEAYPNGNQQSTLPSSLRDFRSLANAVFLFLSTPFLSLPFLRKPLARPNTCTSEHLPLFSLSRGIATEMSRYGARGDGIVCRSSLSSPISRQFHVVHKLSPARARARAPHESGEARRQRRPDSEKGDGSA